jgi:rRNA pseudouridine-1189 N-methylase Emg1 (Nep1/Mra1 family)
VHREQLVEQARPDECIIRSNKLYTHHNGLEAADQKENQGRPDIEDSNLLVIHGTEPLEQG